MARIPFRRSTTPDESTVIQYEVDGVATDVSSDNRLPVDLSSTAELALKVGGETVAKGFNSLPVEDIQSRSALAELNLQLRVMNKYLSVLTNESFTTMDIEREH